jgi:dihydropteroate synthase
LTIPLSVATLEPEVARAALLAGADIINSIDGFRDPQMRRVAAETGAALVVMHIYCQPRVANPNPQYDDLVADVRRSIAEQVEACLSGGISPKRIILDPRAGFGKTTEQDIAVLRGLDQLTSSPYPVLLAVSRTTFISGTLGTDPDNRLEGALAVAAWGVMKGVKIIRVHDVRATRRVCSMVEAVLGPTLMEAAE